MSKKRATSKKCPPPPAKMYEKVQAWRSGAGCWWERGRRGDETGACVEVQSKELKAPKTHPLAGRHRW